MKRVRSRAKQKPSKSAPSRLAQPPQPPLNTASSAEEDSWKQIADLTSSLARAEFISLHAELTQPEVVAKLAALVPRLVKSDRNKALAVAEAAVMIANRLGHAESKAQSLRAKGNAHYALGQNKIALEHHRKALHLFRSLRQAEQVGRTLSSSIQPLILQGRYRQAFAAAREAREIFTRQKNRWRVARLDLNLGNIFDRQDRFAAALQCYKRAYRYLTAHQSDDPEGVAVALHNMAVLYTRMNDFRAAAATYEKARSFAAAHDMPLLVGQADYNIAFQHYLRGDYSRAISMLRAARETCRSAGDDYHVALCLLDLSEIYLELNLIAEAAEAAEEAAAGFGQLGMQYEKAKSIANQAAAASQQGDAERAIGLFLQARSIFVREKNKVFPAVIDLHRAMVLFDDRRDREARKLASVALRGLRQHNLTYKAIVCRLLLARLDLHELDLCQLHFQQSSDQAHVGSSKIREHGVAGGAIRAAQQQCARALKALAAVELPVLSCQAEALKGKIQVAAGHDRRAYAAYQRAASYFDSLRNRIHGEELRISFMKDYVEIYEGLVALCMKRADHEKASSEVFRNIEQAKSRTLFDFLSASRPALGLSSGNQTEHGKKIKELREELNFLFHMTETALLKQAPRHELLSLRAESNRRERELLKLSREHMADERTGVESTGAEQGMQLVSTLTPDQVREVLPSDAVILEYFQAQGQIVIAFLSSDRLQIIPLGDVSKISTIVDLLQLQLSKLRLGPEYLEKFASILLKSTQSHLHELYQLLVEPIRGLLSARHLVIAPHGVLHHLPFQALFDGSQYLIDEFTLSYAPSASVYALCQARSVSAEPWNSESARPRSLVLGVPDPAVPFVEHEVKAVSACLPGAEVFLAQDATAEILRERGPLSRFIHIATHGHFRRDNPMFSGIRLGDSYLSLYDLYQLQLPSELVALSGCSTGLNVVAAGDELLGLARGLIHAGAETSLLTLWDVQDQSTARFMKSFYTGLAKGNSKAVALQLAMRQLKSERPHPYFWAPFILVGKAA